MHSRLLLFVVAALLADSPARAGALASATWTQSLQGNDLIISKINGSCAENSSTVVPVATTLGGQECPTTIHFVNFPFAWGTSNSTSYSVSLFMLPFSINQFTTGGAFPIHTAATIEGYGLIQGTAKRATGITNVDGMVTMKLAAHLTGSTYQAGGAGSTLVKLPLSVGKAGTAYRYFPVRTNPHYLTVDFYAWTPGTRTFTGLTSKYLPLPTPTVVAMGSFNLTAIGDGTVTLVAPSKISIDGMLMQRRTVSFTTLKLTYITVPEPATLLLLGAGVLGLALVTRCKR